MPAHPFRRRRRLDQVTSIAAIDAAASLARKRLDPRARRRDRNRLLVIGGGAAVAAGLAGFAARKRIAGLIGAGSSVPEPPPPPAPPQPANVDLPGPPANTATPLPVPDPAIPFSGDEEAEVQAAAAEAAAIGGEVSEYASSDPTLPAHEEEHPLAEAGGGEAEGQEQTEALLEENLQPPEGQGEIAPQERLDEVIDQAGQPAAGETVEPRAPLDEPAGEEGERKENDGPGWQSWSGVSSEP